MLHSHLKITAQPKDREVIKYIPHPRKVKGNKRHLNKV